MFGEFMAGTMLFRSGRSEYVVGGPEDWQEFNERFPSGKRCTGINMSRSEERFYVLAMADCFDPPCAIVRAENEQEAIELFKDELTWSHVSPTDLADYIVGYESPEGPKDRQEPIYADRLDFNSYGVPCDLESLAIIPVRLIRVEV